MRVEIDTVQRLQPFPFPHLEGWLPEGCADSHDLTNAPAPVAEGDPVTVRVEYAGTAADLDALKAAGAIRDWRPAAE